MIHVRRRGWLAAWVAVSLTGGCLATAPIHPQARHHNRCGAARLQAGMPDRAEVHLRISLEYNPCYGEALHNLALADLMRGRMEAADRHEREAVRCDPGLVQAVCGMGVILDQRGKPEQALAHYREAVRMDPGYLDARRNLVLAAARLGRFDLVRRHLPRLEILSPGDPVLERVTRLLARHRPGDGV